APVLLFSLLLSVLTGVLFGAAPAIQMARQGVAGTLKAVGRGNTGSGARARGALIIAEVALAVVLLAGAGLLINSFARITRVDPGFAPAQALQMRLWPPPSRYAGDAELTTFYARVLAQAAAL